MIYCVTFDIKSKNLYINMVYHCEAKTAAEAKELCRSAWAATMRQHHPFHLAAHRAHIDVSELHVHDCNGGDIYGSDVLNRFCCYSRTLRVTSLRYHYPEHE